MTDSAAVITAFRDVILDVPSHDDATAAYARLFGTDDPHPQLVLGLPTWTSAPGLVFHTATLDETAALVTRRGLDLSVSAGRAVGVADGLTLALTSAATRPAATGDVHAIDHVVLTSPDRDRIIATLSGRLGMDLRLDRLQPWGIHQLFFRCPGLLVEVVLRDDGAGEGPEDGPGRDALWGIAWRTADIDATHARLTRSGLAVSEVRKGAKPGTRVATVKDPALGVPTIVIEQRALA